MEGNNYTWREEIATRVTQLIGIELKEENIYDDNCQNFFEYIHFLKELHPLLLINSNKEMIMVLPYRDSLCLDVVGISAEEYIENAYFNYGWFRGEGDVVNGVYWQPLEKGQGIQDKEKIYKYLIDMLNRPILTCRVISKGIEEIPEPDDRPKLRKSISDRIEAETGFETDYFLMHYGDINTIYLRPSENGKVVPCIPPRLLNDILYHPGECDIAKIANELKIVLRFFNPADRREAELSKNIKNKRKFCMNFWRKSMKV